MSGMDAAGGLRSFAEAHGLDPGAGGALPPVGTVLDRSNKIDGAAHGSLPGGIDGTVAHLTYEVRSNDSTRTERLTAVVTRVPETIGFAPYLSGGSSGHISIRLGAKRREIGGATVNADEGIDEGWLTELLSPAVAEWIARSPAGFGFELADGVLVAVRDGHDSRVADLDRLCEDAAYIAGALEREAVEESSGGQAERSAAKQEQGLQDKRVAHLLPAVLFTERKPKDVADAVVAYQHVIRRAPVTYVSAAWTAFLITLAISVVAGGIYGLLLSVGDPLRNAIIWEVSLFLIVYFFTLRHRINSDAKACAEEAFYREYAEERDLTLEEPLTFAAVHAEAELPGKPVRVLAGTFTGPSGPVAGALALTGDGLERGQYGALVAGPEGPTAAAELHVAAPGISAGYLDELTQTLLLDLATTPAKGA